MIASFLHPWMFLLLIPLALALAALWFKKRPSIRIPGISVLKKVRSGTAVFPYRKLTVPVLFAAAGVMMVIALARPREGLEQIRRRTEGIDIIIAIDLSGSMAAIDIPKNISTMNRLKEAVESGRLKNRLATAKEEIGKFIDARPNDRIGLIAFAPLPYVACPPTLDHAWLIANLDRLGEGMIGDATNIAGPIASAVKRLKDSDAKRKIVVLFTDGRNTADAKITPSQAAKLAASFDITVYTVGIGSANSVIPQETFMGRRLVPVQNEFDEPLLRAIADTSSGKYYRAEDAESMAAAMKEIDSLEKTSFEQQTLVNWRELAPGFLAAALVLLLLGFLLEHTLLLKSP